MIILYLTSANYWKNTVTEFFFPLQKQKIYRNTRVSLGEQEMLWLA